MDNYTYCKYRLAVLNMPDIVAHGKIINYSQKSES